jgi:hypothetical protein
MRNAVKMSAMLAVLALAMALPSQALAGTLTGSATWHGSNNAALVNASFSGYPTTAYVFCYNPSTGANIQMTWTPGNDPQFSYCWVNGATVGTILTITLYDGWGFPLASKNVGVTN